MRIKIAIVIVCLALIIPGFLLAEDLDGKQIVEKMRDRETTNTLIMQMKMIITDKHGDTRERSIINRMKDYPDGGKTVITFVKPDELKATKFLVVQHNKGDDEQFLYLSAIDKVKRISSSQKSGSFMGTDFSYADLQSHDAEKGKHTKLGEETIEGQDCYKVESIPNNPEEYDYSKIVYWVRKDNFIPIKAEFYDLRGDLLKVLTVQKLEKDGDDWIIKDTLMKNVQKGSSTEMQILQYKKDIPLDDQFFTERFLSNEAEL